MINIRQKKIIKSHIFCFHQSTNTSVNAGITLEYPTHPNLNPNPNLTLTNPNPYSNPNSNPNPNPKVG